MKKIKGFLEKIIKKIKSTRLFLMFYNIKVETDEKTEAVVDTTEIFVDVVPIIKTTNPEKTIVIKETKGTSKVENKKKPKKTISKKKAPIIKEAKKTTSKTKLNKK